MIMSWGNIGITRKSSRSCSGVLGEEAGEQGQPQLHGMQPERFQEGNLVVLLVKAATTRVSGHDEVL
jgi:hypothetical protein